MTTSPGVAVAGDLNVDVFLKVPALPKLDVSVAAHSARVGPGGVAGNTASHLVRLGVSAALIAAVGNDVLGKYLIAKLREAGIDSRYVRVVEGESTGVMVIMLLPNGEKAIVGYRGANEHLTITREEGEEVASRVDHVHASGYMALNRDDGESLLNLLSEAVKTGLTTSVDLEGIATQAKHFLPKLRGLATYVFINGAEASELCGGVNVIECIQGIIKSLKAEAAFLKLGSEGTAVITPERVEPVKQRNVVKEPVDTTGAGDAFNAAVISTLLKGGTLLEAALEGNKAGAEACTHLGGFVPPGPTTTQ